MELMTSFLQLISTSATVFAAAAISIMVFEIGIENYGQGKVVRRTTLLRRISFISFLIITFSSLSILLVIYYPIFHDRLISIASMLLFIGISLFGLEAFLLYKYSKQK